MGEQPRPSGAGEDVLDTGGPKIATGGGPSTIAEAKWRCLHCGAMNDMSHSDCQDCGGRRGSRPPEESTGVADDAGPPPAGPSDEDVAEMGRRANDSIAQRGADSD